MHLPTTIVARGGGGGHASSHSSFHSAPSHASAPKASAPKATPKATPKSTTTPKTTTKTTAPKTATKTTAKPKTTAQKLTSTGAKGKAATTKPKQTTLNGHKLSQPPYEVNVGDQIFQNKPAPLKKNEIYRKLIATTTPYQVNGVWKFMIQDADHTEFILEADMGYFHVVGRNVVEEVIEPEKVEKPKYVKGDIVQLRRCPNYPSLETHRARITGDPYLAFGTWQAPVRFICTGSHTAIVSCSEMAFIGHSHSGILIKKVRGKIMKISKPAIVTGIVLVVMLFLGMTIAGNYNSLVTSRNGVDNSWAKVETQYQRRYDLIGNLVESVKGAQGQEQKVFQAIADGRKQYAAATSPDQQAAAATKIETNLAIVPRLQEAYPELKSNVQVTALMNQLTGTEDSILTVRNTYNDTVNTYNNSIESFPKSIFANMFGYHARHLFQADKAAAQAPKVKF